MSSPGGHLVSDVWHAAADTVVATIAGGLVLLVLYPLTLGATAVKAVMRTMRPNLVSHGNRHIKGTN